MHLFIHLNSRNRNWLAVVRDTKFLCTFTLYYKTIEFDFCDFCENYFELSCKSYSMATSFNAEDFMSEPDQDVFDSLRKDDLLALSLYLNLNVKKSWRKIDIQRAIVKHLISADIFDESSLSSYCVASEFDVKKLELSAQLELKKLESLESEREREREERESVKEKERLN